MSNNVRFAALLAALYLGSSIGVSAQQAAPPAPAQSVVVAGLKSPSKWFRAESQHFIVFSDTSNEEVSQLLNNLEKLDYLLRIYTKDYYIARASEQKVSLYYHDRMGEFNEVVRGEPDEAVGLYNSCGAGVQGFGVKLEPILSSHNEQLAKEPLNASLSYLFEAYTRHFLYRHTDIRSPAFYIDGFAQYFSSVRFSDNQMVLGRAPTGTSPYLHFIDNGHRDSLVYEDIFEQNESKIVGDTAAPAKRLAYLAKSWLLMHYLLSTNDNRALLDKYLDLVHRDVPANKAFGDTFGIAAADISMKMWRYRLKGIEVRQVDLPSLPSAQVGFTSLPEAVGDFVLADAALKSCPDQKVGEALLRTIRQKAGNVPNNEFAKLTLSRAQIDWGNAADALPYLTEVTRKDGANFNALYLLGLANLRLAEQKNDSARDSYLQAAMRTLSRARSVNPASAEAAFAWYKAELNASDKPGAPAFEGAISAWKNAHEVSAFARAAALAFAYSGRAPEADNAFTVMAHNARDPETAKWAKAWQSRLSAGVSRSDLLAEMRREPGPPTAVQEWTLASANLMRAVANNAGLQEARGYLETMRLGNPVDEKNQFTLPGK